MANLLISMLVQLLPLNKLTLLCYVSDFSFNKRSSVMPRVMSQGKEWCGKPSDRYSFHFVMDVNVTLLNTR